MEKEQRELLLAILSDYARLLRENIAMLSLLKTFERRGGFRDFTGPGQHSTVQTEVAHLVSHPPEQDTVRQVLEPVIESVKLAFLDSELSAQLVKIPVKGPLQ